MYLEDPPQAFHKLSAKTLILLLASQYKRIELNKGEGSDG